MGDRVNLPADYEVPATFSKEMVLFPHMEVVVKIQDGRNQVAVEEAMRDNHMMAFIPMDSASTPKDVVEEVGTLMLVEGSSPTTQGERQVLLKGLWRVRLKEIVQGQRYDKIRFSRVDEEFSKDSVASLMKDVLDQIDEFVKLIPGIPIEIISLVKSSDTPGKLADLCAYSPNFTHQERLELLRTLDPQERLKKVNKLFETQLAVLKKTRTIKSIPECDVCQDITDKAFEAAPDRRGEQIISFLNHVIHEHTGELLMLLAEKYGPIFMDKRSLR